MENEKDRSTLLTTRNAETAMVFFTIIGCLGLVSIFLHEWWLEKEKWRDALYTVLSNLHIVLASTTLLTIFKEGADIMFTRWQAYRDQQKKKIEQAREAGYKEGYAAAKAEIKEQENKESSDAASKEKKKPN